MGKFHARRDFRLTECKSYSNGSVGLRRVMNGRGLRTDNLALKGEERSFLPANRASIFFVLHASIRRVRAGRDWIAPAERRSVYQPVGRIVGELAKGESGCSREPFMSCASSMPGCPCAGVPDVRMELESSNEQRTNRAEEL